MRVINEILTKTDREGYDFVGVLDIYEDFLTDHMYHFYLNRFTSVTKPGCTIRTNSQKTFPDNPLEKQ